MASISLTPEFKPSISNTSVSGREQLLAINSSGSPTTLSLKKILDKVDTQINESLENFIKDGELNVDLSSVNASITDHETRISVLEADNTTNKSNISDLQTQVNKHEELITELVNASSGLSIKIDPNVNNRLTLSDSGLLVDISDDISSMEATMDSKIESAFTWDEITL